MMNELVPAEFYLGQNYPNPFKEQTTIKYCVAYKTRVRITVYDTEGDIIEKLVDEEKEAGTYKSDFVPGASIQFEGKAEKPLASGNYLYRLEAGNYKSDKQMILEK